MLSLPTMITRNLPFPLTVSAPSVLTQGYIHGTRKPVFISDPETPDSETPVLG